MVVLGCMPFTLFVSLSVYIHVPIPGGMCVYEMVGVISVILAWVCLHCVYAAIGRCCSVSASCMSFIAHRLPVPILHTARKCTFTCTLTHI